jgi:hypothetical protein
MPRLVPLAAESDQLEDVIHKLDLHDDDIVVVRIPQAAMSAETAMRIKGQLELRILGRVVLIVAGDIDIATAPVETLKAVI